MASHQMTSTAKPTHYYNPGQPILAAGARRCAFPANDTAVTLITTNLLPLSTVLGPRLGWYGHGRTARALTAASQAYSVWMDIWVRAYAIAYGKLYVGGVFEQHAVVVTCKSSCPIITR